MSYIDGLDRLNVKLDKLTAANAIQFLREAGLMVERDAKILCPVDDGTLRNSITSVVDEEKQECSIGTNVEYAPYVHQGTGIYAVNGDGRQTPWSYQDDEGNWHTTIGQKPQPFLTPALDQNRQAIMELLRKKIREQVK